MQTRLNLDPAVVREARELAARAGQPIVEMAQDSYHGLGRACRAAAGRAAGRRPRRHAVGQPPGRRRPREHRAGARRRAPGLGRAARPAVTTTWPRWPRRPRTGKVAFRIPAGRGRCRRARRGPRGPGRRDRQDRREPGAARQRMIEADLRAAQAVDLPDRRDRRHLRGHPAGAGGGARGRGHHRGDPVDWPVAAGLRARGRDQGGLRRHLRHAGELPADAGGAGRDEPRARPLRPADQLRLRPVHAGDRLAGRAWSAWT